MVHFVAGVRMRVGRAISGARIELLEVGDHYRIADDSGYITPPLPFFGDALEIFDVLQYCNGKPEDITGACMEAMKTLPRFYLNGKTPFARTVERAAEVEAMLEKDAA